MRGDRMHHVDPMASILPRNKRDFETMENFQKQRRKHVHSNMNAIEQNRFEVFMESGLADPKDCKALKELMQ